MMLYRWLKNNVVLVGVMLGLLSWLLDALLDLFVFNGENYFAEVSSHDLHQVLMRALVALMLITFSVVVSSILAKQLKVEASLRRSDELARLVLDSSNDSISIIDPADFTLVGANRLFLQGHGMVEWEGGKTCHAVTRDRREPCGDPKDNCPLQVVLKTRTPAVVEHCHFGKNGEKFYEEVTVSPILDEQGKIYRVLHVARDITERRKGEEALRASEDRYRAIFENTGAATVIVDPDGTIVMANKKFEQLSGCSREELEGIKSWADFIARDDLACTLQLNRPGRTEPDVAQQDAAFHFTASDNVLRYVSVGWATIPGTPNRVGSFTDVSGYKRVEEALRESEASLALVQKVSHLGSWEWDVEADVLTWSDEMYRIYGVTPGEFIVTYEMILGMVHPDDKESVNRMVNEALYAQKVYRIDFRIVLPDGQTRAVHGQGEVTFDEAGRPLRMMGTVQDVTWRKEAEDALRKSEEKFSKAFHASPDWIAISRAADGQYIEVNEAFLEITGYTREEVIGNTSIEMAVWQDPRDRIQMLRLLEVHGLVRNMEVTFRVKSGELRNMLWSGDIIEYNGEACLIAIARDVTEQRYLEKELLKSQAQLYIKHDELKNIFNQMETIRREWEQTLDCISDMFILADSEGRIKRFNLAVENFTGKTHRDIVGSEWSSFLAESGLQANVDMPGVELFDERTQKWLVLDNYPYADVVDPRNRGVVITIHDVTATMMRTGESSHVFNDGEMSHGQGGTGSADIPREKSDSVKKADA